MKWYSGLSAKKVARTCNLDLDDMQTRASSAKSSRPLMLSVYRCRRCSSFKSLYMARTQSCVATASNMGLGAFLACKKRFVDWSRKLGKKRRAQVCDLDFDDVKMCGKARLFRCRRCRCCKPASLAKTTTCSAVVNRRNRDARPSNVKKQAAQVENAAR